MRKRCRGIACEPAKSCDIRCNVLRSSGLDVLHLNRHAAIDDKMLSGYER